jgi:UDP:flavonoid glycosyltransferase YjiC (YdhE family)
MISMARFLFASVPLIGHINPGLPIVRELVSRGHEVGWYTGKCFQKEVEATGARFFPRKVARDFDALYIDEVFPEKKGLSGLASLKFDVKHLFLDSIPGHLADLTEILSHFPADAVVSDAAFFGMEILHKELRCGWLRMVLVACVLTAQTFLLSGVVFNIVNRFSPLCAIAC